MRCRWSPAIRRRTGSPACEKAFVTAGSASSYRPSSDSDMASSASTFGRPGFNRMASRSGAIGVGELALLEVNQAEACLDLGGAGAELPQRLVRLLRVGIPPLRKRTLPFSGVLLQHRRIRLLPRLERSNSSTRASRDRRNASQTEPSSAAQWSFA